MTPALDDEQDSHWLVDSCGQIPKSGRLSSHSVACPRDQPQAGGQTSFDGDPAAPPSTGICDNTSVCSRQKYSGQREWKRQTSWQNCSESPVRDWMHKEDGVGGPTDLPLRAPRSASSQLG